MIRSSTEHPITIRICLVLLETMNPRRRWPLPRNEIFSKYLVVMSKVVHLWHGQSPSNMNSKPLNELLIALINQATHLPLVHRPYRKTIHHHRWLHENRFVAMNDLIPNIFLQRTTTKAHAINWVKKMFSTMIHRNYPSERKWSFSIRKKRRQSTFRRLH